MNVGAKPPHIVNTAQCVLMSCLTAAQVVPEWLCQSFTSLIKSKAWIKTSIVRWEVDTQMNKINYLLLHATCMYVLTTSYTILCTCVQIINILCCFIHLRISLSLSLSLSLRLSYMGPGWKGGGGCSIDCGWLFSLESKASYEAFDLQHYML